VDPTAMMGMLGGGGGGGGAGGAAGGVASMAMGMNPMGMGMQALGGLAGGMSGGTDESKSGVAQGDIDMSDSGSNINFAPKHGNSTNDNGRGGSDGAGDAAKYAIMGISIIMLALVASRIA